MDLKKVVIAICTMKWLVTPICLSLLSVAQAKEFRWAFQGDVASIDPHSTWETMTRGFQENIYETLVGVDKNMLEVPLLALRWEKRAPKTWRFYLRRGVKFHNGNRFDADDVVFSYERLQRKGAVPNVSSHLERIVKVDDYTVDWVARQDTPALPDRVSLFFIMDREWSERHDALEVGADLNQNYAHTHANGTGPFKLVSRQPGVQTSLSIHEHWWGERVGNITKATFIPIADEGQRVQALISGEVDMAYPVHAKYWKRLDALQSVELVTTPELRTVFLGFDQKREELLYSSVKGRNPFKNQLVREAMQVAIDIEAIKSRVMRNASVPAGLIIAPQISGFVERLNTVPTFDLDKAKSLMAEAGYPDGFDVTLDCPNNRYVNDEQICHIVAGMLSRIGIDVTVNAMPKNPYFVKIGRNGGYDTSFYLIGMTPANNTSAISTIRSVIACRPEHSDDYGAWNVGGYCNPEVDAMIRKTELESDPSAQLSLIERLFEIHKREVGHIILHQQPLSWGIRKGVRVNPRADNVFQLKYASLN